MGPESFELFLIRHAEVEPAYHRVFGGRIDMGLSEQGEAQSRALALFLARHDLDAVYSSPMKRVRRTCDPYRSLTRKHPRILEGLREIDFGAWTGLKWSEVDDRYHQSAYDWLRLIEEGRIPQGEPIERFGARVRASLETVLAPPTGRRAAIFCHGGVIRMMLSVLLELPLSKMSAFEFDYASVSVVQLRYQKREVHLLNYKPWSHSK